jgi:alpha-tubulin suppressor-like RCC1 family protein
MKNRNLFKRVIAWLTVAMIFAGTMPSALFVLTASDTDYFVQPLGAPSRSADGVTVRPQWEIGGSTIATFNAANYFVIVTDFDDFAAGNRQWGLPGTAFVINSSAGWGQNDIVSGYRDWFDDGTGRVNLFDNGASLGTSFIRNTATGELEIVFDLSQIQPNPVPGEWAQLVFMIHNENIFDGINYRAYLASQWPPKDEGGNDNLVVFELPLTSAHIVGGNQLEWATEGFIGEQPPVSGFTMELLRNSQKTLVLELSEPWNTAGWGQGIAIGYEDNDYDYDNDRHTITGWGGRTTLSIDLTVHPLFESALATDSLILALFDWGVNATGEWGSTTKAMGEIVNRAYIVIGEGGNDFTYPLGAPALMGDYDDRALWSVTGSSVQKMLDAKYFVFAADYAELRAANGDGLVGVDFVRNPHAGGWDSTSLNGGWFSWQGIVTNGITPMPNGAGLVTRVFHEGPENAGTLTFVIPMAQLGTFTDEDTNLILIAWGQPAVRNAIKRAYLTTVWPPPVVVKSYVTELGMSQPMPMSTGGFYSDRVMWPVTGDNAQRIPESEYFVMVADYAALRAIDGDGMGGASIIHNPHAGGWNQTAINGDWFSWWEDIVPNGETVMTGENDIVTRVIHEGPVNAGTLTFLVPLSGLEGYPFAAANANFVFFMWQSDMPSAFTNAYLAERWPPPVNDIGVNVIRPMIAAGTGHAIALRDNGTVWTWGLNTFGQLGDGTFTERLTPIRVSISDAVSVEAGGNQSLAIRRDGTVWAWGSNVNGQLGDNSTINRVTPVQVHGLNNIVSVSSGWLFCAAVRSDGTVWTWGQNNQGQLGDNTTIDRHTPVQVQGLSNITAVAAGTGHTLALRSDGTVWAWGRNVDGHLGDGTNTARLTPVQIPTLSNITAIGAGGHHSIALRNDGTVWVWGRNEFGQLGDGNVGVPSSRNTPFQLQSINNVAAIAPSSSHTAVLRNDGTVWAWGRNLNGQLGDNTTIDRLVPVRTQNINDAVSVSAYALFTLALRSDGTILGWGLNDGGRLGDGTVVQRLVPVQTRGSDGVGHLNIGRTTITLRVGDTNGNGLVTSGDATMIARRVAGHNVSVDLRAADINCDGVVSLADVTRLLRALVGYYPNGLCPHGGCSRCN